MPPFRMAVAQMTISADARTNGATVRRLMREAAEGGARLVQFPEGALSGYAKSQIWDWADVDWDAIRDELGQILRLAAELRLWVVLGSAHPLTPPNRPHNSLYVISDRGTIVDRYDKRLCSYAEITDFYTPGFDPVVVEIDGFRFGFIICVEINFPDLFAEYERLGVDAVLLSAYPIDAIFEVKARAYAAINNYWIALSTPAQTTHLMSSELIDPDGMVQAAVADGSDIVIGNLDRDAPNVQVPLVHARPWRVRVRQGDIYASRRVSDPRSADRTCL